MIHTKQTGNTAIIYGDQQISYQTLTSQINKFAQRLADKKPQRIAIYSKNRPEWIYAFYAGWQLDATVVTIDFMSSEEDVRYILNDCQPDYVFYGADTAENVKKLQENIASSISFLNFDTLELPEEVAGFEWKLPENKQQTAMIIYTSGTTGNPKGVMLSYENVLANLKGVTQDAKIFTDSRQAFLFLPLHHVFPLLGSMAAPLFVGGTIVMATGMQSSDMLETLKNNQVAIFIGVPRLYELMYNGLRDKINASLAGRVFYKVAALLKSPAFARTIFKKVHEGLGGHIQFMVSGGAKLDTKIGHFFTTLGFEIMEGFGMTETAPMITFPRPGKVKVGSVGQALSDVKIKLVDGEILVQGPNVMQGYYNRPEETAEVLKDGWLHTGDLGRLDKKGYLYITGRKKEIIVLPSGKNVNPVLLEAKLERMTAFVQEVAVFLNGSALHALIVPNYNKLSEDGISDPETYFKTDVIPAFNESLTPYQRLLQFTLIKQELPRTRLGKIQRFRLPDLLLHPEKGQVKKEKDPQSEEYKTIKVFIESQVKGQISPDDHLEFDIALDSLGKLSLIDFIEGTFGVKIEEDKLLNFPSVRKLVEYIADHKLRHKVEHINWSAILKEKVSLTLPKAWFTQHVINGASRFLFKLYFRFKGQGIANIPEGPCIIAPNHQSYFDGLFVSTLLKKKTIKNTYFYAKKKHVNNAFLRFLARKNNVIVMDLHNDLKESIQKLAEVLRKGRNIIIFPEGTRTDTGVLGEFKQTFAILSKELNVPVVPVAISGAYDALPKGKKFPKLFSRIQVNFLQPVYPAVDHSYEALANKVRTTIQGKLK